MLKEVVITIAGTQKSGKSIMAMEMHNLLEQLGATVETVDKSPNCHYLAGKGILPLRDLVVRVVVVTKRKGVVKDG